MAASIDQERAERPFVLSIDVGSSSIRGMLFDSLGRNVSGAESRRELDLEMSPEGKAQVDAEQTLDLIWECIDEALQSSGRLKEDIAAVASSSFASNIAGLAEKAVITPLIAYSDTRASDDADLLARDLDERAVHDRTGCRFHSSYLPARMRWFARTQPELFQSVRRWVTLGELVELRLFGKCRVSHSIASWSGLLDRRALEWDEELLETVGVRKEQFSPLASAGDALTGLREPFATRWPQLCDKPWFPMLSDGASANLGSGCTSQREVAVTIGTTSAVRIATSRRIDAIPAGLWCYRVDKRRSLIGGAMNEGGNVFEWLGGLLNLPLNEDIEAVIARMQPDAHHLIFLPFPSGERSPGWRGDARALLAGLSFATTPAEIMQAGLEAVAYRIAAVFDMVQPFAADVDAKAEFATSRSSGSGSESGFRVIGSGGALQKSKVWPQILADVLQKRVIVSDVEEASARGNALLALESLGVLEDIADAPDFTGREYEPNREKAEVYRDGMERQKRLYEQIYGEMRSALPAAGL